MPIHSTSTMRETIRKMPTKVFRVGTRAPGIGGDSHRPQRGIFLVELWSGVSMAAPISCSGKGLRLWCRAQFLPRTKCAMVPVTAVNPMLVYNMKQLLRTAVAAAIIAAAAFGVGCKKQAPEEEVAQPEAAPQGSLSASTLPGANDVIAAVDKKDYGGAIQRISGMRQGVSNQQQMEQFTILVDEVKMRLLDEAPNDPQAAGALAALRRITGGR